MSYKAQVMLFYLHFGIFNCYEIAGQRKRQIKGYLTYTIYIFYKKFKFNCFLPPTVIHNSLS